MPLDQLPILSRSTPLPASLTAFLEDARRRIDGFISDHLDAPIPAFVPSDFESVYSALAWIKTANLTTGNLFCEWGSGLGVVAMLAATLEYESVGIEIERDLVERARNLARDHKIQVELVRGSFIPAGVDQFIEAEGGSAWLSLGGDDAYDMLEIGPDDFDLVFAYPWPGEQELTANIFEHTAGAGALLLTFDWKEGLMLQRKVQAGRRKNRSRTDSTW